MSVTTSTKPILLGNLEQLPTKAFQWQNPRVVSAVEKLSFYSNRTQTVIKLGLGLISYAASLGSAYVLGRRAALLSSIYKYPLLGIIGLAVSGVFCKIFSFNKQMKVAESINSFLGQYRKYARLALNVTNLSDLGRIEPEPASPIVYGKTTDISQRFLVLRVKERSDPNGKAQIWRCSERALGTYVIERKGQEDPLDFKIIENLLNRMHSEFVVDTISPTATTL